MIKSIFAGTKLKKFIFRILIHYLQQDELLNNIKISNVPVDLNLQV